MAAVDDFIELLSIKPEKLGKIDCIFPDLGWGRDENGYPPHASVVFYRNDPKYI